MKTRLILIVLLGFAGCSSDPAKPSGSGDAGWTIGVDQGTQEDTATAPDLGPDAGPELAGFAVEVVAEGTETFDDREHSYQLLRLIDHDTGHVAYAQWNEPDGGVDESTPAMVFTIPYQGIAWTGEEVDERWAARGAGAHPDDSEPAYDPATSGNISYQPTTPRDAVDAGMIFLLNRIPTLLVYGRFYAGGSIANDVADMVAGYRYLETRDDIDRDRIGVYGGSWGGFEALYGAAHAPESVRPSVGVALYPLSDFQLEWEWTELLAGLEDEQARNTFTAFFEPYRRRIAATAAVEEDDFSGYTHADLVPLVQDVDWVFVHDGRDNLVPFTQAEDLAVGLPDATHLWFQHETDAQPESDPVGHGVTVATHGLSVLGLTFAPVLEKLVDPASQIVTLADPAGFQAMLEHFVAQQERGQSLSGLYPLMIALAGERVQVFDLSSGAFVPGATFVAEQYNTAFGTNFGADTIRDDLAQF